MVKLKKIKKEKQRPVSCKECGCVQIYMWGRSKSDASVFFCSEECHISYYAGCIEAKPVPMYRNIIEHLPMYGPKTLLRLVVSAYQVMYGITGSSRNVIMTASLTQFKKDFPNFSRSTFEDVITKFHRMHGYRKIRLEALSEK